jgi:hypothetical protein
LLLAAFTLLGCTTHYQVRGTETLLGPMDPSLLVGDSPEHRARQISMEHQSIEKYDGFSLGVIEISDEGAVNPTQKEMVMDWIKQETQKGGLLVVFAHGWHHEARTCDDNLCCFRTVLNRLKEAGAGRNGKVVGLYLGWRGESLPYSPWNVATLWGRKHVAEHIGRTAGKEILLELEKIWKCNHDLTMVTVGHSLGGALVFSAVKGKLTGNISDIVKHKVRSYRVVRTAESRVDAFHRGEKARRAGFGDLVILVNPAIEAREYELFDNDLQDNRLHPDVDLVRKHLPLDKKDPYPQSQLPILMTVASENDYAVGGVFPLARWIEALVTFHWRWYFARSHWKGMGHYAPQVTHLLEPSGNRQPSNNRKTHPEACKCEKITGKLLPIDPSSIQSATNTGVKPIGGGLQFGLTEDRRLQRGWDDHSPYLVVQADRNVINGHNDIFNPTFVAFLRSYISAYQEKKYGRPLLSKGAEGEKSTAE